MVKLKGKESFLVLGALVIVGALILGQIGVVPFTIVSSTTIAYNEQGNKWVGEIVVNQPYESFELIPIAGSEAQTEKTVKVSFRQLQPQCVYAVYKDTRDLSIAFGFIPITKIDWLNVGGGTLDTPYRVAVYLNGVTQESQQINLGLSTTGSVLGPTTVSFANGKVKLNNLGNLTKGISCPNGGDIVLVWNSNISQYEMYEKNAYSQWINEWQTALATYNFPVIVNLYNTMQFRLNQMTPTGGWLDQVISTNANDIAYLPASGTLSFIANMEKNVAAANVQVEVAGDYIVTYFPANPVPKIISMAMPNLKEASERVNLNITVKNIGTLGRIELHPYSENGLVSFAPVSIAGDWGENETRTETFRVYGLNEGSYSIKIVATGVQSGISDWKRVAGIVYDNPAAPPVEPGPVIPPEPPTIELICGDGVCVFPETWLTCPIDCESPFGLPPEPGISDKEECLSRLGDGIFVIRYNWTEPQVLGLIAGTCDPVYNWPLIILAIVAIGGLIGGLYIWKKVK